MNLAIKHECDWISWIDVPEKEIMDLIKHRLFDDDANVQEVDIHVWQDTTQTPTPVQQTTRNNDIEVRVEYLNHSQ